MRNIILPARCDRAAAEELLPEFVAALGSGPFNIDASQTTQIGQAMLQILVAVRGPSAIPRCSTLRISLKHCCPMCARTWCRSPRL